MTESFGFRANKEEAEILNAFLKSQMEKTGLKFKSETHKHIMLNLAKSSKNGSNSLVQPQSQDVPQVEAQEQDLIKFQQANKCENCISKPFMKKDLLKITCTRPIFKQTRYGNWVPSGKVKGEIPIEECISYLKYRLKKEETQKETEKQKAQQKQEDLEEHHQTEASQIRMKPESSIEQIVNQLGVCENPISMRDRMLLCKLCSVKRPQKWQACQEIQKEIKTDPVKHGKFMRTQISKLIEEKEIKNDPFWLWQSRKTEDMSLEEIEKELPIGLDEDLDLKLDAIRKRYEEICVGCEEHTSHLKLKCSSYCKRFLKGLELPKETVFPI